MSYKETEETLKRLLNKLESLEAEFLVERGVYKEAFKKDLVAARNVVKKLNEGNCPQRLLENRRICSKLLACLGESRGSKGLWFRVRCAFDGRQRVGCQPR